MDTLQQDRERRESIDLPEFQPLLSQDESGVSVMYGAAAVAAAYCGLDKAPSPIPGYWMHGWEPSFREKLHPDLCIGITTNPDDRFFVDRRDTEVYFRERGYENVRAIGLPMIYVPGIEVRRRPGTLLVMPAHSIDYTTHSWKFDEYAEAIAAIRSDFDEVLVCLHHSCWRRGYWVDEFRRRGFQVIKGADSLDRNGLRRIQYIMCQFEYVTTNAMGSQIAYAAYFGAKPSIYGPHAHLRVEDLKEDPLYTNLPKKLVERAVHSISEEELRRHLPHLFCHPREARADVEWGRFELGESNKVSPREMRALFGWDTRARFGRSLVAARRSLAAALPSGIKHGILTLLNKPAYREYHRLKVETERLLAMPRHQPTRTDLLGPTLEVPDGPRFVDKKRLLFDHQLYRFVAEGKAPRILDCGAGIGLSVCYFKRLYPESNITAFEPDPQVYAVLERNCQSWGAKGVRLIPRAVWNWETTLPFARVDDHAGRIRESAIGDETLPVQTCRLRDFLSERVDLLRLNIEGAEVDVLLDCSDLLGNIQSLIVEYHSLFGLTQRLDTLIGLLTRAGFRMHFRTTYESLNPLVYRSLFGGMDTKISIFAYRI
jgi:FkbM family methyltransferase